MFGRRISGIIEGIMSTDFSSPPGPTLFLHTHTEGDAIVVQCKGQLVSGTAGKFHTEVKALFPQSSRLILDLTDVAQMDSSGLGAIAGLYISAKVAGCGLELINLSKRVRELMSLTNILLLFEHAGKHNVRVG